VCAIDRPVARAEYTPRSARAASAGASVPSSGQTEIPIATSSGTPRWVAEVRRLVNVGPC
jgi:hypothetical protein